ncbi:hypothetical protein VNI00_013300 [Paramarasmius palmivorus]|uniref:Uncharacterized protein n=1 Tax=Paramarasmius palmivorus TaxID=297713 RepID=A0AAW0C0V6_9AGAR
MAPISASDSDSPSSAAIMEASMNNSDLPRPLLIAALILTGLYAFAPPLFRWLRPPQSVIALRNTADGLWDVIKSNTSVTSNRYKLQNPGGLKERLRSLEKEVKELEQQVREEPPRIRVFAWTMFEWNLVKRVNECYDGLRKLEGDILIEIENGNA